MPGRRGRVPTRLRALPEERLGCTHLALDTPTLDHALERYAGALRYGRQIQSGTIRPHEATEAPPPPHATLPYPTCAVCQMDLRRPFVCLTCAYTACFFRDPVTDAHTPGLETQAWHDGSEEGTSHIGLHLAEEAHAFGMSPAACP